MSEQSEDKRRPTITELEAIITGRPNPNAKYFRLNPEGVLEFASSPDAPAAEQLSLWMIENGFATGHGDSFEGLLGELSRQVKELREAIRRKTLEEVEWTVRALKELTPPDTK
jgi:hypothetical protein